jgi:hypothetical protein
VIAALQQLVCLMGWPPVAFSFPAFLQSGLAMICGAM